LWEFIIVSSDDEEELEDLEAEDVVLASASKAAKDDDFDVRFHTEREPSYSILTY
jgi:hypothetical protein